MTEINFKPQAERPVVRKVLTILGKIYKFDQSLDNALPGYQAALRDLSDQQIREGTDRALRLHKWKTVPNPAALRGYCLNRHDRDQPGDDFQRPQKHATLNVNEWVYWRDAKGNELAWHPNLRDTQNDGKPFPEPPERIMTAWKAKRNAARAILVTDQAASGSPEPVPATPPVSEDEDLPF